MSSYEISVAFLAATLLLNTIVSIAIAFSSYFTRRQKAAQIALVWVLPFLGSVIIGLFLAVQGKTPRSRINTVGATDLDSHAVQLSNATQGGL